MARRQLPPWLENAMKSSITALACFGIRSPLLAEGHHVVLLKGCREYFPRLTPIESAPKRSCFGADSYVSLSESPGGFVLVVPIDANHCQQAGGLQLDGTKAQLTPTR